MSLEADRLADYLGHMCNAVAVQAAADELTAARHAPPEV
jgi:hypothetical protein